MCTHIFNCDIMGNMTLAIPNEIQKEMKRFPEIKWSEVARRAIKDKIEALKIANKIASKSKLTPKDVKEFSKQINSLSSKRFFDANNAHPK